MWIWDDIRKGDLSSVTPDDMTVVVVATQGCDNCHHTVSTQWMSLFLVLLVCVTSDLDSSTLVNMVKVAIHLYNVL